MRPKPWSHSALTRFVSCPKAYHDVSVIKLFPDSMGEAGVWGNRVHDAFEQHLKHGMPLEPELVQYQGYLDAIKATRGTMHVECEYALDSSLNPVHKFGKSVFVRGIIDVLHLDGHRALALDHKIGKRKPDSKQMKLMTLLIFAHHLEITDVKVGFFWLKEGKKDVEKFTRADIPQLWNEFLPDVKQWRDAFLTDTWQPRQNGLCHGYCPVTTCEFWRPKRVTNRR